jgi:hypothetical protein
LIAAYCGGSFEPGAFGAGGASAAAAVASAVIDRLAGRDFASLFRIRLFFAPWAAAIVAAAAALLEEPLGFRCGLAQAAASCSGVRGPTQARTLASWSASLSPGKSGRPDCISAAMHPSAQTSTPGP